MEEPKEKENPEPTPTEQSSTEQPQSANQAQEALSLKDAFVAILGLVLLGVFLYSSKEVPYFNQLVDSYLAPKAGPYLTALLYNKYVPNPVKGIALSLKIYPYWGCRSFVAENRISDILESGCHDDGLRSQIENLARALEDFESGYGPFGFSLPQRGAGYGANRPSEKSPQVSFLGYSVGVLSSSDPDSILPILQEVQKAYKEADFAVRMGERVMGRAPVFVYLGSGRAVARKLHLPPPSVYYPYFPVVLAIGAVTPTSVLRDINEALQGSIASLERLERFSQADLQDPAVSYTADKLVIWIIHYLVIAEP